LTAIEQARRVTLHRCALRLEYFTVGWNVIEAGVAIAAGVIAGSVALIGFGVDSGIEIISAVGLLWRLRAAGPNAEVGEETAAEKRALYVVAVTFFLLAAYITYDAVGALVQREQPLTSPAGIVLAVLSLAIMPVLAYAKQRTGREMGSRALVADAKETWVCSYLSLALLIGVGLYALAGWWWADPIAALAMLPVIVWQGWETLAEARETDDNDNDNDDGDDGDGDGDGDD
jgi:Predicted Co/Zn/Cd cation transporters